VRFGVIYFAVSLAMITHIASASLRLSSAAIWT
jgi:hypothetical protein